MIPRVIHQSWKDTAIPAAWRAFQESWRRHHPGYEYRLWTDADNRAFVAAEFPDLLPVYDGYRHPICRADLARYLVVARLGGIYADLDCEALRPLDDLIAGRTILFGLEPEAHARTPLARGRGFGRILCNAVFAAAPGHDFWQHLISLIVQHRADEHVLDTTGPFLLTRAWASYPGAAAIPLLPSHVFCPLDNGHAPTAESAGRADESYARHHWAGTWWRKAAATLAHRRLMERRGERHSADR